MGKKAFRVAYSIVCSSLENDFEMFEATPTRFCIEIPIRLERLTRRARVGKF